eukprot:3631391-Pyramimonas_sp.AAC.1
MRDLGTLMPCIIYIAVAALGGGRARWERGASGRTSCDEEPLMGNDVPPLEAPAETICGGDFNGKRSLTERIEAFGHRARADAGREAAAG